MSALRKKSGAGGVSDSDILHVHAVTFQYDTTSERLVAHAGFAENGNVTEMILESSNIRSYK